MVTAQSASEILARYASGATVQDLAASCSCTGTTMRAYLIDAGATIRPRGAQRKYTLNETFFDVIDTEEKAYWLGFLFADGSVYRKSESGWVVTVALKQTDAGQLCKWLAAIGSDAPVERLSRETHGTMCHSVRASAFSTHMAEALIRHGCVPNKTHVELHAPTMPEALLRHFYRGLVDGDGGFKHIPQNFHWAFYCTGAPTLMAEFQVWLMQHAGAKKTKLSVQGCVRAIRYGGTPQVRRIWDLLYSGAQIYLDRKFEIGSKIGVRENG